RHAEGPRLPASSPSAPPPPSGGIASPDKPAPAQRTVQLAAKVSTILDPHALDVDVDATDAAAVQRHNGLRASLAYQGERGSSDDAAVLERGDTGRRRFEDGPLDAVALRDIADEAAHLIVQSLGGKAELLQNLGKSLTALLDCRH